MTKGKKIGSGVNGTAYLVVGQPTLVIKKTSSKKELELALEVQASKPTFFCNFVSVTGNEIVKEKVNPIEDAYGVVSINDVVWNFSGNVHNYLVYSQLHLITAACRMGLPLRVLSDNLHLLEGDDLAAANFLITNESGIDSLDIDWMDIHCNLGRNSQGEIVIFDADKN